MYFGKSYIYTHIHIYGDSNIFLKNDLPIYIKPQNFFIFIIKINYYKIIGNNVCDFQKVVLSQNL